ncbi:MAG: hypothetical protein AAFX04_04055 [Pseudomonadota bacterium]
MQCCKLSPSNRNTVWLGAGAIIGLALMKKANEGLIGWYDRGLETLQLFATMVA